MSRIKYVFLILLFACSGRNGDKLNIYSPDGKVAVELKHIEEELSFQVFWNDQLLLDSSALGLVPDQSFTIISATKNRVDQSWKPVWGQFSKIRDHYGELELTLDFGDFIGNLFLRAYNQGVAFRFIIPENQVLEKVAYRSEYKLTPGSSFYFPSGENEPVGPVNTTTTIRKPISPPVVVETPTGMFMSILESDLYSSQNFQVMNIEFDQEKELLYSLNEATTTNSQVITPWRVILLGETVGDLVTSSVPVNLAAPNKLEDASWVKPGKTLWDWRVHGFTTSDGFTYGVDTKSYLRFIDFAAENDIEYFLIDANWYSDVDPGVFIVSDKLDLKKVADYATKKGVDLLLYYDNQKGEFGDEALFSYYESLGMKGIKYGFMGEHVPFTQVAIELAAESHLLINFHDGPVPMTGIRRTLPNAVTREYCHAQQDARRVFTPEAFIKMALINAIQGPLDMNNGNFDILGINAGDRQKGPRKLNSYLTTVTAEAARTLIIFSGLVCIPDAPEAYAAKQDLFEFIKEQPVGKWDESQVLHSKIGEYICTARRYEDEWFIGSVMSQKGGSLDIPLDFLKEGITYDITFY
ncbi:MAG: glycoside hydrolase family 97 catalytic domain-containing protein, partial [Bacteroidota bacterium]